MKKLSAQSLIALILATNMSFLSGANPSIGVALASGNITIDKASTPGNAPLFEGNTVETDKNASRLQLNNGVRVVLASESRGKVYRDRLVLEKGATQVTAPGNFGVAADFLRITGTDSNSSATVAMRGQTVQVASLQGTMQVANAQGVFLTKIAPGMAFDFTRQDTNAGAGAADQDEANKKKKKKKTPVAAVGGGSATTVGAMGASHATIVVAGIVVAAAVGTTVGVIATEGQTKDTQAVSPARP
ncbi:MAG: hypothetical protein M3Z85_19600 [Acidobacteriota bacterium]|nr:hypothetical protein [Acidobacteriota bacterium]